jgi:hypothetical protein
MATNLFSNVTLVLLLGGGVREMPIPGAAPAPLSIPGALFVTLILAFPIAYAWRQVRTGEWSSFNRNALHSGAVRVSGGCGLVFCGAALVAIWWTALAHLH